KKDVAFDKVTVGGVTIDKNTNKVSGLAAGELSATSTDAVNGSQLHATNQDVATNKTNIQANADNIAKGINVGGTTGSNQYALGDTINIKGDSNISSTTVAGGVQLALAPVLNVGPATGGKPVKIDGNAGTVSGLSNTTFDPANITSGQAATEDQLKAVNDKAVAAKTKVTEGDNISVTETVDAATGASTYTVATKKDVAFDKVTVGGVTIDKSTNKISGLAAGVADTDAVNMSQLNAVKTLVNAGWTVTDAAGNKANIGPNGVVTFSSADSNISVKQNGTDQDGKVEIALSRDLDVDSVTAGGNKLDANGLTIAGGPTISAGGIDMGGKKISNLGDGTEDGDAVNLGQLRDYVGEQTAKVKTHYYSVNDGGSKGSNYDNDGATASGAIAAGVDTTATAENAVAMGKGAAASHAGSVALGAGAKTEAVDNTGTFMLNGGTAAGVNAVAVVSVGSKGNERRIVNVAAGRLSADSTDAVNGSQLFAVGTAVNNLGNATALALGGNTTYTPGGGLSVNLTVGGNTYTTVQDALNAVSGGGSGATKVVAGTNTQVTQNGDTYTVSVVDKPVVDGKATFNGGIEVAGGQSVNMGGNVISNVGAGVAATDAVNVGQLNGAIAGANAYTDNRFNQLANDMWQLDRGYRGATASAMAMAGLPQAYLPGKSMFSAAVGGYRGEYGLAFGLSGITDNGKWVYKAQASGNTARDWGFSAGVGVQW
ncbi:MAG: YadA family autotransporter adhesin, partial [Pseudomonadota bacterium]|nr:YadA family autotransporter adhesin [Pseudomonadota bacterium]